MAVTLARVCGHTFALSALDKASVVLDLGMNKGEFATWIVSHTPATCFGVEPVPGLFSHLPAHARIHPKQVAIGGKTGSASLHIYKQHDASLHSEIVPEKAVETISVRMYSLFDLIAEFGIERVDLLKIDIEGAELDILENGDQATLTRVAQISVEFHDFIDPDMAPRIKSALRRLRRHGFLVQKCSYFDHSDVLALNTALLPLSAAERLSVRAQAIAAMVRRRLKFVSR